jgi:hypothetical protein
MCVTRLLTTSRCGPGAMLGSSPARVTIRARHRVLREASSRGDPRSVDRGCAGRNASSVKGLSPDSQTVAWWPSKYGGPGDRPAKAIPAGKAGTTGVRDHGMHRRPSAERERSAQSRVEASRPWPRAEGQGLRLKSAAILRAEVRCLHSSEEAGQCPWSEGRHGE